MAYGKKISVGFFGGGVVLEEGNVSLLSSICFLQAKLQHLREEGVKVASFFQITLVSCAT